MHNNGYPPAVDRLARHLAVNGYADLPAPLLVDAARTGVDAARAAGRPESAAEHAEEAAGSWERRLLQPVINATGVLLHTNLGRSPLAVERPGGYANLELDLGTGRRGDRSASSSALLARICGADAAHVVNNGAAALLLALSALASGREVVASRGEMIEIGGGFRLPEVLAGSGARLREVGTTNRTRPSDYLTAVGPETGALLKVHPSNYRITGFTQSTSLHQLAEVVRATGRELPVIFDAGSGLIDERCPWIEGGPPRWLAGEPAVRQSLAAGADLVTFSGDKLFGGPQAGIIAGRADLVETCRRHPLARALRAGGLVLEALQEVALSYLRGDAGRTLPLWSMATSSIDELRGRARALNVGEVVDCRSVMGGGSLPGRTIASAGVAIAGDLTAQLRAAHPPIIARVEQGRTVCDLRTVRPDQDSWLAKGLAG